jgi:2-amino-4-hydroxy-6-hydroxymethyldihydropteridine diphosphokinase
MTGQLVRAVVAIGANLADPARQVEEAFLDLAHLRATRLVARSALYRTAPVGAPGQPDYVNACALLETSLGPRDLLEALLAIEREHGRVRDIANGARTLDLDIILYGDSVIAEPGLAIPHPRAHERAFVLAPLADVWPDARIPGRGDVATLLAGTAGQRIERIGAVA